MKSFRFVMFDVLSVVLAAAYALGFLAAGDVLLVGYWVMVALGLPLLLLVLLVSLVVDEERKRAANFDSWRKPRGWWRQLMSVAQVIYFAAMGHQVLAALLMVCTLLVLGIRGLMAIDDADRPDGPAVGGTSPVGRVELLTAVPDDGYCAEFRQPRAGNVGP